MIQNLSNHNLAEEEFSVLNKGLSFAPTPTNTFKQKITKSWSNFKTHIHKTHARWVITTIWGEGERKQLAEVVSIFTMLNSFFFS